MKKLLGLAYCLMMAISLFAQKTFPQDAVYDERDGHYAFINANVVTAYNTKAEQGTLIIKKGKIVNVGKGIPVPKDAVVIDLQGKYIYPSFLDLYSNYGLPEPKAVGSKPEKQPQEYSNKKGAYAWNEALKCEFEAAVNFKGDKKMAEEYRKIGFGAVLTHQMDGISRGSSAMVLLGDEREHLMLLKEKAAAHLTFSKGKSTQNYPTSQMGAIALLRQTYLDGDWYKTAGYKEEKNLSLQAWNDLRSLPQIFGVSDRLEALRAARLGKEFGVTYIIRGGGDEYQRIDELKKTGSAFILPLKYPEAYDVEDPFDARVVTLAQMKHWELAPTNAARLAKAGIEFTFTSHGLKKRSDYLKNIRKAVENGLSETDALKAMTLTPAKLLGADTQLGSLERGKLANFLITSGNIFKEKTTIHHNWVNGKAYVISRLDNAELDGKYQLTFGRLSYELEAKKMEGKTKLKLILNDTTKQDVKHQLQGNLISLSFSVDEQEGFYSFSGLKNGAVWNGRGTNPKGEWIDWTAKRTGDIKSAEKKKEEQEDKELGKVIFPFVAYGAETLPTAKNYLIKNATVWTNERDGILENTDVLLRNGKISKIGKNLTDNSCTVIDGTGKHLTAGIVDEHSHMGISKGVNESAPNSSAEVRIGDVVNSEDVSLYRHLAGGVTTSQLLHGSANPIGGQSALIKPRWGLAPEAMKLENSPKFIKFALGENVKQSNWGDEFNIRFPQSRMGVEQVFIDHFTRAKEYEAQLKSGQTVRRDLELEALLEIINSQRFITCHSYVQSEINMLMKVAEMFNFRINTFTHILEGYKVAEKMKAHGAGGSTFSDWWAYKYEVIDAIPYNGAIMHEQGVLTAFNSDSHEMGRRLNQEAAKAVMYGDVSEEEAWKFVTLNPAKLLRIDDRVGSIKAGKDGDVVLWSDNPLSIYAQAEKTFVDGILYYSKEEDLKKREAIQAERNRLIQKMLGAKKGGAKTQKARGNKTPEYHCDDLH